MTSLRQIAANQRNALKSTGPATEQGKQRSRCNAVRHGLTAETVIGALENAEDYQGFEAAITADYDAQTAVERELVLRLASLLWRLRRATAMETGLFDTVASHRREFVPARQDSADSLTVMEPRFGRSDSGPVDFSDRLTKTEQSPPDPAPSDGSPSHLARCFLRVADLPSYPLDRLSRYEATLWRQAGQILFALDALGRRKPRHRSLFLHMR
jgi:hypothetical protein